MMIYFDNAATTLLKPPQVIRAVTNAMQTLGNCGRGSHSCSRSAAGTVYEARVKLADFQLTWFVRVVRAYSHV